MILNFTELKKNWSSRPNETNFPNDTYFPEDFSPTTFPPFPRTGKTWPAVHLALSSSAGGCGLILGTKSLLSPPAVGTNPLKTQTIYEATLPLPNSVDWVIQVKVMTGWQSVCWGKDQRWNEIYPKYLERPLAFDLATSEKPQAVWLVQQAAYRADRTEIHGQGHISVMFHWCATLQPVLSKLTGMQDWTVLSYEPKPTFC